MLLGEDFSGRETSPLVSIAIALRLIMAISVVMEEGFRFSRPFVVATIRGAVTFLESITLLGVMSIVMVESFSLCICLCISFSISRPFVVATIRGAIAFLESMTLLGVMSMVMVESFSLCFSFSFCRPLVVAIVSAIGQPI